MRIFMSGEIGFFSDEASEAFRTLILEIEERLNSLLKNSDYGDTINVPLSKNEWVAA